MSQYLQTGLVVDLSAKALMPRDKNSACVYCRKW